MCTVWMEALKFQNMDFAWFLLYSCGDHVHHLKVLHVKKFDGSSLISVGPRRSEHMYGSPT